MGLPSCISLIAKSTTRPNTFPGACAAAILGGLAGGGWGRGEWEKGKENDEKGPRAPPEAHPGRIFIPDQFLTVPGPEEGLQKPNILKYLFEPCRCRRRRPS